ncbi:hypothetical protein EVAR_30976_1 [Eumeta japonica]|uniref:Uncharacterized protein n=1 Tax=Eumeta variegata TaxID=151549 RepID=A0A4C1W9Y9_EUMVA|nr:hypothetical protein EVAR_30976_1 [Eumeta japonica]
METNRDLDRDSLRTSMKIHKCEGTLELGEFMDCSDHLFLVAYKCPVPPLIALSIRRPISTQEAGHALVTALVLLVSMDIGDSLLFRGSHVRLPHELL